MREFPKNPSTDVFETYAGDFVQVWCLNYIYAGRLAAISDDGCWIRLENAGVVYETGELKADLFKDFQQSADGIEIIQTAHIESIKRAPQLVIE